MWKEVGVTSFGEGGVVGRLWPSFGEGVERRITL